MYFFQILLLWSGLQIKYSFVKSKHLHPCIGYVKWKTIMKGTILNLPMLKCVWKVHHKNWTFQQQKLYKNVIHWIVASNAHACFRIVMHCYATFSRKIFLYETNNIFCSLRNQKWDKTNNWSLKHIENKYEILLMSAVICI